ncbi:MAG: acetyl-CoA hydrolase/transferase C-terminal domain-containing protein [Armatimonadota bacterium]|nr:acetyl-CoA hydrolase/transferase C-terminal domain-containing protein [Armatimonadota bacterium]MDR7494399.1 acetyl-CoA hydrolase/transferase C-terminal domain-containing protein [Armatimonadota bacterium]MDR7499216.1 acetyl-CoA hydrolase/transferase C-terminal domain-containing protein [Armatimonadota bacterium]MDR7553020.1 acetyl-CoA hydrolase/transferase C-terminal domain-containing protein [Armatimonadota bacterium]MDR7558871.1 acetyl-CoA hydrolase/transferase C-terminal domain-containin
MVATGYAAKIVSADEAVRLIRPGMRVYLTGNCSVPQTLLRALVARAPELHDVEIVQVLTIGPAEYVAPGMEAHLRVNTLFISDNVRQAVNEGRADFTPCFLGEVPRLFKGGSLPLDVALVHVSPPDEHGFCSFGIEVGLTKPAAQAAKVIIAEMNPRMPRTLGDSFIHISKLHYIVPVDYPLPEIRMGGADEEVARIADHVAGLIPDGATLQTGIGAIPDAVLARLTNHKDLGIHTELFSDGIIDLILRGVITGERKTLHPGKVIAGFVLGTQRLYDFIHDNPVIEFHPTDYVNDPFVIAQNARMVAINSAIEVDLTGQVCADSIGTRLYSGVGGQVDFIYGASRSAGGIPIIALPSTALGGRASRIVATLKPGAGVTTSRNHVHYVVTEHGVAALYGKTIRQRARALIAIAAPAFREQLEREARALRYL